MSEMSKVLRGKVALRDDHEKVFCRVYTQLPDPNMKKYPDDCIVVRNSVKQVGALPVAKMIVNKIQNDPELFGPDNMVFKFAFPYFGASSVILEFTGENMDEDAYNALTAGLARVLYIMVGEYADTLYLREEARKKVDHCIRGLAEILNMSTITGETCEFVRCSDESDG